MFRIGLADLDELILLCRDDKARSNIAEAVSCYKVGAYRQCIVATWIAVVYDIIHKLQELDLTGDKTARTKLDEYQKIWQEGNIQKALEYERQILDMARGDFELLSAIEYSDLVRIRDDRNRCAHPTLNTLDEIYLPPAELARTHLRNAVTHLLQRPPVQGKAALDRVLRDINSDYFPGDVEEAKNVFKTGPMSRPRESLVRNFALVLIKTLLFEELSEKRERSYIAALKAIRDNHRGCIEETFEERLNDLMLRVEDNQIINCVKFMNKISDVWHFLEDGTRTRLQNYVRDMPDNDLVPGMINALDIPELYPIAYERLNKVQSNQLSKLIDTDHQKGRTEFIHLAVQMYINSENFDQANLRSTDLIVPSARYLDREQIEQIIRAARENSQILHSYELRSVFYAIRNSRVISEENLNKLLTSYGFEGETVNEADWEEDS